MYDILYIPINVYIYIHISLRILICPKKWISPVILFLGCFDHQSYSWQGGLDSYRIYLHQFASVVVSKIFYVHPENWRRWTHFDEYFSDGLVQPPTSFSFGMACVRSYVETLGVYPKMDGLWWKTLLKLDDLGEPLFFWKHPYICSMHRSRCANASAAARCWNRRVWTGGWFCVPWMKWAMKKTPGCFWYIL